MMRLLIENVFDNGVYVASGIRKCPRPLLSIEFVWYPSGIIDEFEETIALQGRGDLLPLFDKVFENIAQGRFLSLFIFISFFG